MSEFARNPKKDREGHTPVYLDFDLQYAITGQLAFLRMCEKNGINKPYDYDRTIYEHEDKGRRVVFSFNCPNDLLHLFNEAVMRLYIK